MSIPPIYLYYAPFSQVVLLDGLDSSSKTIGHIGFHYSQNDYIDRVSKEAYVFLHDSEPEMGPGKHAQAMNRPTTLPGNATAAPAMAPTAMDTTALM